MSASDNDNDNGNGKIKKKVYSYKYGKKVLMLYDTPYFGLEDSDKCGTVTVSIPHSLINIIERYTQSENISKSRYIRLLVEKDLGIYYEI